MSDLEDVLKGIETKDLPPSAEVPMTPDSTAEIVQALAEAEEESPEYVEEKLYSGQDVAKIFRVSTKTVLRWSHPGGEFEQRGVQVLTTIGGHRRYLAEEIHQLFQLMLEGKLYDDNDNGKPGSLKKAGPGRIAGLPKPSPRDPRFE